MDELPEGLARLASRQAGVVTRRQLLEHGVTKAAIRWNAGRTWRVILPCTYVLDGARPSGTQLLHGALLLAGPRAALAGVTAAQSHGLTNARTRGRVHVVVPGDQASRVRGYVTIRRSLLVDHAEVVRAGLRLSSVARSCVDAAVDERTLANRNALIVEAVQRRLTTVDDLAEWCYRLRPRDAARVLPSIEIAAAGVWSVPEAEALDLMATSRVLPAPMTNPSLVDTTGARLLTPDLWLDDVAMAVMVHSRTHHANGTQFTETIDRDADLVAAGVVVLGVTPSGMRQDPAGTLRRIEAAYAVAQARPRPTVRARWRAA